MLLQWRLTVVANCLITSLHVASVTADGGCQLPDYFLACCSSDGWRWLPAAWLLPCMFCSSDGWRWLPAAWLLAQWSSGDGWLLALQCQLCKWGQQSVHSWRSNYWLLGTLRQLRWRHRQRDVRGRAATQRRRRKRLYVCSVSSRRFDCAPQHCLYMNM